MDSSLLANGDLEATKVMPTETADGAKLWGVQNRKPASWAKRTQVAISALFAAPEVRRSIWFSLLLLIALVMQLVADTVISILVGKVSSDLADARGTVSTIMGFSFFCFGFLTDITTSKIGTVAGLGDKSLLGKHIKTALISAAVCGLLTILAFGPTYKLWLKTFESDEDSNTYKLAEVWYFVRLAGMAPNLIYNSVTGILQGLQLPYFIVANNIFLACVDMASNYLFLNVIPLGPVGSPLGVNIAFVLSLVAALWYIFGYKKISSLFELKPFRSLLPKEEMVSFLKDSLSMMTRSFLVEMAVFLVPVAAKGLGKAPLVVYTTIAGELGKYSVFIPQAFGTSANILGSYYRGKGEIKSYRLILRFLPLLGVTMGALFVVVFLCTGYERWPAFFFQTSDPSFTAIADTWKSVWPIFLIQQMVNAMLSVYEGTLYSASAFTYIRNVVIAGFALVFAPLLALGALQAKSLELIMVAELSYDTFRCVFYAVKVHTLLPRELDKAATDAAAPEELGKKVAKREKSLIVDRAGMEATSDDPALLIEMPNNSNASGFLSFDDIPASNPGSKSTHEPDDDLEASADADEQPLLAH